MLIYLLKTVQISNYVYVCILSTYIITYIPITNTVPCVLVVVGVDRTMHWKVVVPLIENTVNEFPIGIVGLFS